MLHGNWTGVTRKLENFKKELQSNMKSATTESAALVESAVRGHLENQDLPWQNLSPAYLKQKLTKKGRASRSLSKKILIATGTYFQSITTHITDNGLKAFIGVRRGVAREKDRTNIVNIAAVHESGCPKNNIPKRPLWQPTFDETEPKIKKIYQQKLKELLRIWNFWTLKPLRLSRWKWRCGVIEFCFSTIEYYLKQVENSDKQKVFAQSRRLVREKPDFDFIRASVTAKNPYCLNTISDYQEQRFGYLFDTYPDYRITDIVHQGTGSEKFLLEGKHQGNNAYILKISTAGTVGPDTTAAYQLKINKEEYTDPLTVPADGIIPIEDNLSFNFEIGEDLVEDDTYSFETVALQIKVYKEKEITLKILTEIWSKSKQELFATGGYFDQLSKLVIERYITDGVQVINVSPSSARWVQSEFEAENELVRGALETVYQGALYTKKYDALITKFLFT